VTLVRRLFLEAAIETVARSSSTASVRPGAGAIAFTLGVSCCFGIGAVLAKLAYNAGSNPLTIVTIRTVAAFAWLALLLSVARVPLRLPPPLRKRALAFGVLLVVQTMGLYVAVAEMAPPLALLTFCTYPIFTTLVQAASGREPITPRRVCALALAFGGLVLTLNTGSLEPTTFGVIAATIGSVAFTAILVLTPRLFPPGDSRPRTLHMSSAASALLVTACAASGGIALPATTSGWIGFWGVCISFPLAITGLFVAIGKVGPSRAALLLNFEPVAVTIFSAVLLGQTLTGWQLLGGALVLSAIALIQWPARESP
jgi:drug/metabolite transporter (DMT)-like permease